MLYSPAASLLVEMEFIDESHPSAEELVLLCFNPVRFVLPAKTLTNRVSRRERCVSPTVSMPTVGVSRKGT